MSLDSEYREVRYDIYCEQCKHKEETGYESVCEEFLDNPTNLYTDKPDHYISKNNSAVVKGDMYGKSAENRRDGSCQCHQLPGLP